jgi:hypothetical protein
MIADDLNTIRPEVIAAYLLNAGWRENGAFGKAVIWSQGETDVLIPVSAELRDYPLRVAELVGTVAAAEQRSREQVLRDLRSPRLDVQYIRTMPEGPSGTTPLRDGFKAVKGVQELFLAAATSLVLETPIAALPAKKPQLAWNFLDDVRLGLPGEGSYVFRVETPLDSRPRSDEPLDPRTVLLRLREAAQAAHLAARQSARERDLGVFEEYVGSGVTANLCEALTDIGGRNRNPFEIRFAWAPAVPPPEGEFNIAFDSNVINQLHVAGKHLRELPSADHATVTGQIRELRQELPNQFGRALIEGVLQVGQEVQVDQRVWVYLSAMDYRLAIQAHDHSAAVIAAGRLRTSGRRPEITAVSEWYLADTPPQA